MARQHPASRTALVLLLAVCAGAAASEPAGSGERPTDASAKNYQFSTDWHSHTIPTWRSVLAPYVGRRGLRYLEVGVYEGRSLFWVLENIATHPSSRLTGIDIELDWSRENLEISGAADRIEMIEGRSQAVLRSLAPKSFDIVYIDGSHRGGDVLVDAVLSWALLRDGGTLIFDDYMWRVRPGKKTVLPMELRPKEAIDVFLTLFRDQIELVHRGYQLIVRRQRGLCSGPKLFRCSRIGNHVYDWDKQVVSDPETGKAIPLSERELALLERLLLSIKPGELRVSIPPKLQNKAAVLSLQEKLKLESRR